LPVRLYILGTVITLGVLSQVSSRWSGASLSTPVAGWFIGVTGLVMTTLLVSISERAEWGSRVLGAVPTSPLLRRVAFIFYSGAVGGVLFCVLVFAACGVLAMLMVQTGSVDLVAAVETIRGCTLLGLYGFAYALTALFMRHRLNLPGLSTWAVALVLMALGTLVPFFIAFLVNERGWEHVNPLLFVTVPFWWIGDRTNGNIGWTAAWIGAIVALAINIPWFLARFRLFKRPAAVSRQTDGSPLTNAAA
jgi:hypothetical protein